MTTTESYGCDRHGEDAYQGCAMCDLESLRSRLAEVEAEHAAFSNNVEQCEKENDRLRDWQRRAVVELTLAQYRVRDHPDQDGFNNMRALIEEADHE